MERLLGSKLDAVRRDIAAQRQRVTDALSNLSKLEDLDSLDQEYQNKKKDTEFRLELFRKHGVEQQLRRQVEFNTDVTQARRVADATDGFVRAFDTFLKEQEVELAAQATLQSKENADLIAEINVILERIRKTPNKARLVLAEARDDSRALREKLTELETPARSAQG